MIEKSTVDFLKALEKNNERDWFNANKDRFIKANDNIIAMTGDLAGRISKFDAEIEGFDPKTGIFRIYRDVRFAKDKSPYKTNLGAFIAPGGRKTMAPGYYFHIQPKMFFCAAGKYMPDATELLKIRDSIVKRWDEFRKIVESKKFLARFGDFHADKLTRPPKGFAADHPAIEYIKFKSFTVAEEFKESEALSKDYPRLVAESFKAAYPFISFLRSALK